MKKTKKISMKKTRKNGTIIVIVNIIAELLLLGLEA
jgi:hypothetical protein